MSADRNRFTEVERVLKALANRRRLAIVQFLNTKGPASVGDIAEHIRLSFAATSRHLRTLAVADLVESEQVNTTVKYSVSKNLHPIFGTTLKIL